MMLLFLIMISPEIVNGQTSANTFDYGGKEFSVGHTICTPFIFEYAEGLNKTVLTGSDVEVVKYMERALNFRARYV